MSETTPTTRCDHCGLPAPAPVLERDGDAAYVYCCTGCAIVARTLRGHGLTSYYDVRARDEAPATPARATGASYAELDDPAHQRAHVRASDDGAAETSLYLEDLRCTACVWLVEATPQCLPGVRDVRVDLGRGKADVVFDPARHLAGAVARTSTASATRRTCTAPPIATGPPREDRAHLLKIGIAGAAVGNLMLLAASRCTPACSTAWPPATCVLSLGLDAGGGAGLTFAALPFFRTALGLLRAAACTSTCRISVGILVGLGWGSANVVRGVGEIYFDSLAHVDVPAADRALGRQGATHRRASSATELLAGADAEPGPPGGADRRRGGARAAAGRAGRVPAEALAVGDRVQVRPGERDAGRRRGACAAARAVDAGLLSGESRPIEVGVGDRGPRRHRQPGRADLSRRGRAAVGEATRVGKLVARIDELSAGAARRSSASSTAWPAASSRW
jgi:Cu2+-exporting ATPase